MPRLLHSELLGLCRFSSNQPVATATLIELLPQSAQHGFVRPSVVRARRPPDHLHVGPPPELEAVIRTALSAATLTPDDALTADPRG